MRAPKAVTATQLKQEMDAGIPGCLWIMRFDAEGRAAPGVADDFERLGKSDSGFVWLHLDLSDVRSRALIAKLDMLTDDARATLSEPVQHQFLEHDGRFVSGAVIDHERSLDGRTSTTDFLRFALGDGFLVSARRKPMNSAESTRLALRRGEVAETPLALFELIVEQLCAELSRMNDETNVALDRIEDALIEGHGHDRAGLGAARRDAVRIARQIWGLGAVLHRLEKAAAEPEHKELQETAARLAQRTEALSRDVLSIQDRARLLQDELHALLNLETNDRLYVLTVVTTMLLPATFVTGYFGMNTKNLLFSENENGSLVATLLCILASAAVLWLMRRLGLTRGAEAGARHDRLLSRKPDRL